MKKEFIISYKVVGGGGNQTIELEIPEGAYDLQIQQVAKNPIPLYLGKWNLSGGNGGSGKIQIKDKNERGDF